MCVIAIVWHLTETLMSVRSLNLHNLVEKLIQRNYHKYLGQNNYWIETNICTSKIDLYIAKQLEVEVAVIKRFKHCTAGLRFQHQYVKKYKRFDLPMNMYCREIECKQSIGAVFSSIVANSQFQFLQFKIVWMWL